MGQIKDTATIAKTDAQAGFNAVSDIYNISNELLKSISNVNDRIATFLNEEQPTPSMVRDLAESVLSKNIKLNPNEIRDLVDSIESIVGSLTDSERIIEDAADDLERAALLLDEAVRAKEAATGQSLLAENIVVLLSEAEIAAENAATAVEDVEWNIQQSQRDLTDIFNEIELVDEKIEKSTMDISELEERLTELQTQLVKNEFIVTQEIGFEIDNIANEAETTRIKTKKLVQEFDLASESLEIRTESSQGAISRSKMLLQRASELAADTTTKFKDITGMEGAYLENEKTLADLVAEVETLTNQMERHFDEIQHKSQTYSRCFA